MKKKAQVGEGERTSGIDLSSLSGQCCSAQPKQKLRSLSRSCCCTRGEEVREEAAEAALQSVDCQAFVASAHVV